MAKERPRQRRSRRLPGLGRGLGGLNWLRDAERPERGTVDAGDVKVLVTGSLHLVGGLLEVLEPS